jgi:hypothetical protein
MTVMEIEKAIQNLSSEDFSNLMFWLSEYKNNNWDKQIEEDYKSGKLQTLIDSALEDIETSASSKLNFRVNNWGQCCKVLLYGLYNPNF